MKQSRLLAVLIVLVSMAAFIGLLALVYGPLTALAGGESVRDIPTPKDKAAAINTVRQTLLATAAGAIALGGLLYSARTFYLTRRGHLTDRYTRAIALLGSDKTAERVGGVYALEHLMWESAVDHQTVVDVLAAFIPRRASTTGATAAVQEVEPQPGRSDRHSSARAVDIQAALTVLGRRPLRSERHRLGLALADLGGADLRGANLSRANLREARLTGANLLGADLTGANLLSADLTDAKLAGANLTDAKLGGAQPAGPYRAADLTRADLRGVDLTRTDLRGAILTDAQLPESLPEEGPP